MWRTNVSLLLGLEVKKLSMLCKRNQGKVGDQFILVLEIEDKDVHSIWVHSEDASPCLEGTTRDKIY